MLLTAFLFATECTYAVDDTANEPLHPADVRAYLDVRAAISGLRGRALANHEERGAMEDFFRRRDQLLRRHGWSLAEFERLQLRIAKAREMLARYDTLLARQAKRARGRIAVLESEYLSERQKARVLHTADALYATEMERVGMTRRDWSAVAPYLAQLDRRPAFERPNDGEQYLRKG